MIPFFSTQANRNEQIVGRTAVTAAALLFLLVALLRALPSRESLEAMLEQGALAGYESIAVTTPHRDPVLEEFFDRAPQKAESRSEPSAQADPPQTSPVQAFPPESSVTHRGEV